MENKSLSKISKNNSNTDREKRNKIEIGNIIFDNIEILN